MDADSDNTYGPGDVTKELFDYTVRADGKRTEVVETNDLNNQTTIDWVYDELGRLNEEKHDSSINAEDYVLRYGYDLASNRLRMAKQNSITGSFTPDETTVYDYDASDRLQTEVFDGVANDTNTRYTYTGTEQATKTVKQGTTIDQGNLVSTTTYSYDVQGRLKQIASTPAGGQTTTTSYQYNDDGIRVSQSLQVGAVPPPRRSSTSIRTIPLALRKYLKKGPTVAMAGCRWVKWPRPTR